MNARLVNNREEALLAIKKPRTIPVGVKTLWGFLDTTCLVNYDIDH